MSIVHVAVLLHLLYMPPASRDANTTPVSLDHHFFNNCTFDHSDSPIQTVNTSSTLAIELQPSTTNCCEVSVHFCSKFQRHTGSHVRRHCRYACTRARNVVETLPNTRVRSDRFSHSSGSACAHHGDVLKFCRTLQLQHWSSLLVLTLDTAFAFTLIKIRSLKFSQANDRGDRSQCIIH